MLINTGNEEELYSTSRLVLGTAALPFAGDATEYREAEAVVREALSCGIRWIDTASLYAYGCAQAGIGRALADVPRESFQISTKVGYVVNDETMSAMRRSDKMNPQYPPQDFSYDTTLRSFEYSLSQLNVTHVDTLFLHAPAANHLADIRRGAWPALEKLKEEGSVLAIGIGVTEVQSAMALIEALDLDCIMMAGQYTLLEKAAADYLFSRCLAKNIRLFAGGILNSGLLSNPYAPNPRYNYRCANTSQIKTAQQIDKICRVFGLPIRTVAIHYVLKSPYIEKVVIGPSTIAELRDSVGCLSQSPPPELWDMLDSADLLPQD